MKSSATSRQRVFEDSTGFTLVEVLAVLVIIGVLGALGFGKADAISGTAIQRVFEDTLQELNSRERVTWTHAKLSDSGWVDDGAVFSQIDLNFGSEYHWSPIPDTAGGRLHFRSQSISLQRTPSTTTTWARWKVNS
jgi:prepilin-type N-terminal cleavage/methylation domain-containing protein